MAEPLVLFFQSDADGNPVVIDSSTGERFDMANIGDRVCIAIADDFVHCRSIQVWGSPPTAKRRSARELVRRTAADLVKVTDASGHQHAADGEFTGPKDTAAHQGTSGTKEPLLPFHPPLAKPWRGSTKPVEREHHLESAVVKATNELGGGVCVSQRVVFQDGTSAVFKPASGEYEGLRDNIADGYSVEREVAAWNVAKLVGMDDLVSPAVGREVGDDYGSLAEWQDGDVAINIMGRRMYDGDKNLARAAVFDFVIGNEDRHAGNWIVDDADNLHLIDHGLTFPETAFKGTNRRFLDRAEMLEDDPELGSPKTLAQPYVDNKGKIAQAVSAAGLSSECVDGVKRRID